jgi:hypothetical protein
MFASRAKLAIPSSEYEALLLPSVTTKIALCGFFAPAIPRMVSRKSGSAEARWQRNTGIRAHNAPLG